MTLIALAGKVAERRADERKALASEIVNTLGKAIK
jgi:hypothetical protein